MLHILEGLMGGMGFTVTFLLLPRILVGDPARRKQQLYLMLLVIPLILGCAFLALLSWSAGLVGVALILLGFFLLRRQRRPDIVVPSTPFEEAVSPQLRLKLQHLEAEVRAPFQSATEQDGRERAVRPQDEEVENTDSPKAVSNKIPPQPQEGSSTRAALRRRRRRDLNWD